MIWLYFCTVAAFVWANIYLFNDRLNLVFFTVVISTVFVLNMLNNIAEKVKEMNYVSDCVSRLEDEFEKIQNKFHDEFLDIKFKTNDIDGISRDVEGISRDINSLSDEVYMTNQNIGDLYQTVENVVQETKDLSQVVGANCQILNDHCEKDKYKEE